jgi:hypothetical protein
MKKSTADTGLIVGKAYWCRLKTPDDLDDKYKLDIGNLSTTSKSLLKKNGVRFKNKGDERGDFVTAKSKFRITQVEDDAGIPIDVTEVAIGNGSDVKVRIKFNPDHPMAKEFGTALYLNKVKVMNLVPYFQDNDPSEWEESEEE